MLTRRMWITLTSLVWLCACGPMASDAQTGSFRSSSEVLDARGWDFSDRIPLRGNWTFIENRLIDPALAGTQDGRAIFFPSLWNDIRPGGRGTGCATYSLTVLVPAGITNWSFEIPPLYNSYNLWVNGTLIASAGVADKTSEKTVPQWIYQLAEYETHTDTLKLVLQIANYHHHKGGAVNPIYLGAPDPVKAHFNWAIGSSVVEAALLFSGGLFFIFFYRRNRKKVILYFAMLCITWSIRAIFSNLYPLVLVFPGMNWEWVVKIEYITLYLTVIWAALFFDALFQDISNPVFTYLPVAVNLFFILFTLLTPAIIYTRWISIYLAVAVLVIMYGVTMVVRALIIEKDGSWFLMGSIWTGIVLFSYDLAAYYISFSYNIVLINIGYVLIFVLTTIGLLYHLGIFRNKNVQRDFLTMKDMYL